VSCARSTAIDDISNRRAVGLRADDRGPDAGATRTRAVLACGIRTPACGFGSGGPGGARERALPRGMALEDVPVADDVRRRRDGTSLRLTAEAHAQKGSRT
jgi:hypothetical protein